MMLTVRWLAVACLLRESASWAPSHQNLPYASSSSLRRLTRLAQAAAADEVEEQSDRSLLEQMRKALGERDDAFADAEKESKQLMKGLRDLDRDPNMKANNKFIEWLADNGVWVKTESSWGRAPHPLVIASNTEDDGESCGRGLLARESMTEGELMMTIPLDLCLTRAVSQETFGKAVVPDYLDEYIAIALLLMHEKLKGSASRWKEYFDVLPDAEEVYPSYIWTEVCAPAAHAKICSGVCVCKGGRWAHMACMGGRWGQIVCIGG